MGNRDFQHLSSILPLRFAGLLYCNLLRMFYSLLFSFAETCQELLARIWIESDLFHLSVQLALFRMRTHCMILVIRVKVMKRKKYDACKRR
jgi:hypothetical protein